MVSTVSRSTLLATLAAALLAGCGGGPSDDTPQGEAVNPGVQEDSTDPKGRNTVVMKNIEYAPKELTVKVGQTVTWVNQETIEHNVVAEEADPPIRSQLFGKDGKFTYKPTQAGTISYVCTVHPGMDGTLTVE